MTAVHQHKWLFHSLAASGAAGMFLGPDRWLGIDIGADGSAVLYAALCLLAVAPQVFSEWLRPLVVAGALIGLLIAKTLTENVYTVARYWRTRA